MVRQDGLLGLFSAHEDRRGVRVSVCDGSGWKGSDRGGYSSLVDFVCSQRAFLVVVATEQAIALCKTMGVEVPDVSDEVKQLVEVHSAPH